MSREDTPRQSGDSSTPELVTFFPTLLANYEGLERFLTINFPPSVANDPALLIGTYTFCMRMFTQFGSESRNRRKWVGKQTLVKVK